MMDFIFKQPLNIIFEVIMKTTVQFIVVELVIIKLLLWWQNSHVLSFIVMPFIVSMVSDSNK